MSRRAKLTGLATAALVAVSWNGAARAVVLSLWTFETSIPTTAGPHAAEGGVNAGAGSAALGFHASASTVYSNPAGNGSVESFSSNFWGVGDYYQFSTSTLGYDTIRFGWDQIRSSSGPGVFDVEYSTDGVAFTTLLDDYVVLDGPLFWSSGTPQPATSFAPIAAPAALSNQATVFFRLTAQVAAAGTSGTNRVDNVMIEGNVIPEPTSLLLLGLGAALLLCGRRLV